MPRLEDQAVSVGVRVVVKDRQVEAGHPSSDVERRFDAVGDKIAVGVVAHALVGREVLFRVIEDHRDRFGEEDMRVRPSGAKNSFAAP